MACTGVDEAEMITMMMPRTIAAVPHKILFVGLSPRNAQAKPTLVTNWIAPTADKMVCGANVSARKGCVCVGWGVG
jgi:hypothetical protein